MSRDGSKLVQDIFGNNFHLGNDLKSITVSPKPHFSFSDIILKMSILTFRPKLTV